MPYRAVIALAFVAVSLAQPTTSVAQSDRLVVLVRHAEAGGEPESDPPLTPEGRERAAALAEALADANIGAVIVSPLARTRLTAEPLTTLLGITPVAVDVTGGIERHVEDVADAVRSRPPGEAVLVVGHSNTIPAVIKALGGPELPDLCHGEFATLFVLEIPRYGEPHLIRASYGMPDVLEEGCERGM